ncbi:hypothetical protein E2C01_052295 [Portunus trituberculatus]|uniref:Uncharacterized protein n=1 Tax=Portunus trituberculatus TaxID=210409 RepID=A0A5B7GL62_PORTR|nr:hypothetical protein [Portunus trituberculatus]
MASASAELGLSIGGQESTGNDSESTSIGFNEELRAGDVIGRLPHMEESTLNSLSQWEALSASKALDAIGSIAQHAVNQAVLWNDFFSAAEQDSLRVRGASAGYDEWHEETGSLVACVPDGQLYSPSWVLKRQAYLKKGELRDVADLPLACLGTVECCFALDGRSTRQEVFVVKTARNLFLSLMACKELGLVPDTFPFHIPTAAGTGVEPVSDPGLPPTPKRSSSFAKRKVDFVGFSLGWEQYKPSSDKLAAIKQFPMLSQPTITDIWSWYGLVNQLAPFMATAPAMEPFRALLRKPAGKRIYWDLQLQRNFELAKDTICRLEGITKDQETVQQAAVVDPSYQLLLTRVLANDWPAHRGEEIACLHPYYAVRDRLAGLVTYTF